MSFLWVKCGDFDIFFSRIFLGLCDRMTRKYLCFCNITSMYRCLIGARLDFCRFLCVSIFVCIII